MRARQVGRPHRADQGVVGAVSQPYRLVLGRERGDGEHRAEDLLAGDRRRRVHPVDQRGGEVGAAGDAVGLGDGAAANDVGAADGLDVAAHPVLLPAGHQRAEVGVGDARPDGHGGGPPCPAGAAGRGHGLVDLLVPRPRHVAEDGTGRRVDVRVGLRRSHRDPVDEGPGEIGYGGHGHGLAFQTRGSPGTWLAVKPHGTLTLVSGSVTSVSAVRMRMATPWDFRCPAARSRSATLKVSE